MQESDSGKLSKDISRNFQNRKMSPLLLLLYSTKLSWLGCKLSELLPGYPLNSQLTHTPLGVMHKPRGPFLGLFDPPPQRGPIYAYNLDNFWNF